VTKSFAAIYTPFYITAFFRGPRAPGTGLDAKEARRRNFEFGDVAKFEWIDRFNTRSLPEPT